LGFNGTFIKNSLQNANRQLTVYW